MSRLWWCLRCFFAVLPLACGGCARLRPEAVDYRFRESLAGQPFSPHRRTRRTSAEVSKPRKEGQRDPLRHRVALRGRQLVGERIAGHGQKTATRLLERALAQPLADRPLARSRLKLRRESPRPGEIILFGEPRRNRGARKTPEELIGAGIVLDTRGPRVRFVYVIGGRARTAYLDLRRRHLRRAPRRNEVLNTYVRVIHPDDPPETRYLAGELFLGTTHPRTLLAAAP